VLAYALLAFGAVVCLGVPVGLRALGAHYAGTGGVGLPWLLFHGHVQIIGFLGTLVVGLAPHLLARVTGRPAPTAGARAGVALLGVALALRAAGVVTFRAPLPLVAATLEATVFVLLVIRVWRALSAPSLAPLRRHLVTAGAWLVVALVSEVVLRVRGLLHGTDRPTAGDLHELHLLALFGGIVGWVLAVLVRGGPALALGAPPPGLFAAATPWLVGAGALLAAGGEIGHGLLARVGDVIVLGTATAVVVAAGVFRRGRPHPRRGASGDDTTLVKLAIVSLLLATAGALVNLLLVAAGRAFHPLTDAVLHLLTVGALSSAAIATIVRVTPTLEGRSFPLRPVPRIAALALAGALLLRTAQVMSPFGGRPFGLVITASGLLAWIAFASVTASLVALAIAADAAEDSAGV
jgi:hypothetical protein